jgi:hypothetical protein
MTAPRTGPALKNTQWAAPSALSVLVSVEKFAVIKI